MSDQLSHENDIIRETTSEGPFLLDGEQIELEASQGISATIKVIAVVLIFVPPLFFVWSILLVGFMYMLSKKNKIWVTKKRVVYSDWKLRNYFVISVPLSQIKEASISRGTDIIDLLLGVIDRIFGTSDVVLVLKGDESTMPKKIKNRLKNQLIQDVKAPKKFIQTVNSFLTD